MLLALCTTPGLSAALALPNGSVPQDFLADDRASNALDPMIRKLLEQTGAQATAITEVALTVGPGSFTGIRLGLAYAEGLKAVMPDLPMTGLCTLGTLALQHSALHHATVPFTVALDAAGGQAYTQTFTETADPLTDIEVVPVETLTQTAYPLYAQAILMLSAPKGLSLETFTHIEPEALLLAHGTPTLHRPPVPQYVKPLGYTPSSPAI